MKVDGDPVRFAPNTHAIGLLILLVILPFVGAWKLALFLFAFFVLPTLIHLAYLAARGRVTR